MSKSEESSSLQLLPSRFRPKQKTNINKRQKSKCVGVSVFRNSKNAVFFIEQHLLQTRNDDDDDDDGLMVRRRRRSTTCMHACSWRCCAAEMMISEGIGVVFCEGAHVRVWDGSGAVPREA